MPTPSRSMLAAYAVAAAIVLVAVGRWAGLREGSADRAPGTAGPAAPAAPAVERPAGAGRVVVHVAGAVRRPGVYRLARGARVRDAVARAGGPGRGADPAGVNLAAKVADGQQVIVPRRAAAARGAGAAAGAAPGGPVSLNAATAEQLDELDGIGPATAQKILEWRRQHGGFAGVDDLAQVPGIGPKKLESLRAQVAP